MKRTHGSFDLFKIGLIATALTTLVGCEAYVGDDGYYGGGVDATIVAPGPVIFGDFHDHGHDVRVYSHRGYESRGAVHGVRREEHHR